MSSICCPFLEVHTERDRDRQLSESRLTSVRSCKPSGASAASRTAEPSRDSSSCGPSSATISAAKRDSPSSKSSSHVSPATVDWQSRQEDGQELRGGAFSCAIIRCSPRQLRSPTAMCKKADNESTFPDPCLIVNARPSSAAAGASAASPRIGKHAVDENAINHLYTPATDPCRQLQYQAPVL